MEKHYVCSECKYLSQHGGVCQTDDCLQQGISLKECHCEDGKHEGVLNAWKKDEEDSTDAEGESEAPHENTIDLDSAI